MPLARVVSRLLVALACLAASACESVFAPPAQGSAAEFAEPAPEPYPYPQTPLASETARPPLMGTFADMVLQRVEPEVSPEEVFAAIQPMVADARACVSVPAVWLSGPPRAGAFIVRYDLMQRDWGDETARSARARMDELVAAGFLTEEDQPETGPGAVRYDTTRDGREYLRGAIDSGQRPAFCAPAGRRVVEITSLEWGRYPCGSLRVRFTHVADDWPAWARHEATRARLAQTWPPNGEPAAGEVSLSRQWFTAGRLPRGTPNGQLISACMDDLGRRVIGNDLNLTPPPPP